MYDKLLKVIERISILKENKWISTEMDHSGGIQWTHSENNRLGWDDSYPSIYEPTDIVEYENSIGMGMEESPESQKAVDEGNKFFVSWALSPENDGNEYFKTEEEGKAFVEEFKMKYLNYTYDYGDNKESNV